MRMGEPAAGWLPRQCPAYRRSCGSLTRRTAAGRSRGPTSAADTGAAAVGSARDERVAPVSALSHTDFGSHSLVGQRHVECLRLRPGRRARSGRLKMGYGLMPIRVRGIAGVALHADLVMLARLSQALARARAVRLAP